MTFINNYIQIQCLEISVFILNLETFQNFLNVDLHNMMLKIIYGLSTDPFFLTENIHIESFPLLR